MMEQPTGLVRGVTESMDGELHDLVTRVQDQWTVFEKKWTDKIVQHDDKEVEITRAEHRIMLAVQKRC